MNMRICYKHKIFIAGNHDNFLYGQENTQHFLPANCHYLCHSGVEINGIKFWGIPFFLSDGLNGRFSQIMRQIPTDIDILISHCPPYGILDTSDSAYGCPDLLLAVLKISPSHHLFGHVHAAYGCEKWNGTTFVNASLTNEDYELVNEPFVVEV
jgi:Icc-related predicted phosphoesterase